MVFRHHLAIAASPTPCIVPHDQLFESEKKCNTALEALMLIIVPGY